MKLRRTFFICWNLSKKEPSLENTFVGFALTWLDLWVAETVDEPVDRAGEAMRGVGELTTDMVEYADDVEQGRGGGGGNERVNRVLLEGERDSDYLWRSFASRLPSSVVFLSWSPLRASPVGGASGSLIASALP